MRDLKSMADRLNTYRMETSKTEPTVDPTQTLQSLKIESNIGVEKKSSFSQHQITSSSVPVLIDSLTDVNRATNVLPKQLTDILCHASVATDSPSAEAVLSASQGLLTSASVLHQTYVSESYIPVTSSQQLPVLAVSDLVIPVSDPIPSSSTINDSSPVTVEDPSVSLQSLYSTVSHLHQMFVKNPHFLAKSPHFPISSPASIDTRQKLLSGDAHHIDMTQYYSKTESVQEQSSLSPHVPLIQIPNPSLYKYSEVAQDSKPSDTGSVACSEADPTHLSFQHFSSAPSHDVKMDTDITGVRDNNIMPDSAQHMIDTHYSKEEKISPQQNQAEVNEVLHYNQDQLKQFYHSHLVHATETRPASTKYTYSEPAIIENHTVLKESKSDTHLSEPVLASQVQVKVIAVESLKPDPVDKDCICEDQLTADAVKDFDGLPKGHKNMKKDQRQSSRIFTCGGCSSKFSTICRLHAHLKEHASGGSYHFDHVSRTAFPKYDTFCSYSQTDFVEKIKEAIKGGDIHENQSNEEAVESDRNMDNVVVTRRATRRQEEQESGKETSKPTTRSQNRSGRKRKQDNPKPTKPRMYVVPIVTKGKKSTKERKSKGRGRGRKTEQKSKEVKASLINNLVEDCKSDKDHDASGHVEVISVYIDTSNVEEESEYLPKEDEKFIIIKEEPAENLTEDDSSAMSKPFKKRGRSRKTVGELSKISSPKDTDKKIPVNKSKKSRKQTDSVDTVEQEEQICDNVSTVVEEQAVTDEEDSQDDMEEEFNDMTEGMPNVKCRKTQKLDQHQICDICGLTVPKYKYVFHMRSHTGERPFICEKCGKSFARSRFLTKHLITHQEVKPWRCDLCPSQFCQKNEYNMHMRGHAGDRPYKCNVCEMRFLSKTSLHTHQANIHMGLTRFECEVCKRRFFKRSSLNVHQATHFEATLKCSFCDRKFRDKTGVKRHERIHTGVKKFKCHICEHAFIQSTPYWTHMEKRHSMSKAKVKEMLKQIKESNRRSGIKMEINILPADVDHQALVKTDNGNKMEVTDSGNRASEDFASPNALPKFQHLSIVHGEANNSPGEVVFSQNLDPEQSTAMMLRHYGIHSTTPSQGTMLGLSLESTAGSAINLTNSLQSLGGLPSVLQPSMVTPPTSLQLHGLIGINNLQQALDYTSSLPQSASYTDISNDRVVTEPQ